MGGGRQWVLKNVLQNNTEHIAADLFRSLRLNITISKRSEYCTYTYYTVHTVYMNLSAWVPGEQKDAKFVYLLCFTNTKCFLNANILETILRFQKGAKKF